MFNKVYEKTKRFILNNYKFIIALVLIIFIFYYEFPCVIYKPGGVINLNSRIEVDNKYNQKGDFYLSYVTSIKGTIPFIMMSYIIPNWDLVPLKEITPNEDYDMILRIGKEYLNAGIDNAIVAAFNETNYHVSITNEKYKVIYINELANTNLQIGDELVDVDGNSFKDISELRDYINTLKVNDSVIIKVLNNKNKIVNKYAKVYKENDNSLRIGIAFKMFFDYETEIPVSVKSKYNESGSSGGLITSLAIYNALTEDDITHGYKITGTGTIDYSGNVGEIDGIKYKLLGAEKNKADIFFCPSDNYKEAIKIKKKNNLNIKIVKVNTLKEAINYLNNL